MSNVNIRRRKPLSDEAVQLVAQRFAVLGEPTRLRILQALCDGEQHVTALVEALGVSQTNVSRHLQVLAQHGLLSRRRADGRVYYAVADPTLFDLCELVCGSLHRHLSAGVRTLVPGAGTATRRNARPRRNAAR